MPKPSFSLYQHPLLNYAVSTRERLTVVAVCAALPVIQSAFQDNGASLIIALAAIISAVATELCINIVRGKTGFKDCSAIVTALILTNFLPNNINPAAAAAGAFFAIAVVKMSFGGFGTNWLNPALGGWFFIHISWPRAFNDALQTSPLSFISKWMLDESSGESPLAVINKNGFSVEHTITSFLNNNVFSIFNVELPESYIDFFVNQGAGIIADRGIFALILGTAVLIAIQSSRYIFSVLYLAVYSVIVLFAGAFPFGGTIGQGDVLFCLFSGGTLCVAFFLAVEPVTGPKSSLGRAIYMILAAVLSFFFRYIKADAYGAVLAIAFLNTALPFIRILEERMVYEKGLRSKN